jgi:hypothetical protein
MLRWLLGRRKGKQAQDQAQAHAQAQDGKSTSGKDVQPYQEMSIKRLHSPQDDTARKSRLEGQAGRTQDKNIDPFVTVEAPTTLTMERVKPMEAPDKTTRNNRPSPVTSHANEQLVSTRDTRSTISHRHHPKTKTNLSPTKTKFGFNVSTISTNFHFVNPLKSLTKQQQRQHVRATNDHEPNERIVYKTINTVFGTDHRAHLYRICVYLTFRDIGRLIQVCEATNVHLLAYVATPAMMRRHHARRNDIPPS